MSLPLVSVVVVTYNQERWVSEAVRSAVDQAYPNLEVIVADDASQDRTPQVLHDIKREAPPWLHLLLNETNRGVSSNVNRALRIANGDYVAFLAGDDAFLPGKIAAQVEWLEADPARILCGHDVEVISAEGSLRNVYSSDAPLWDGRGAGEVIRRGAPFPATSMMVRASRMPEGGFDERMVVNADWAFIIECLLDGGDYGVLPRPLGRYRVHAGSLTSRFRHDLRVARTTFDEAMLMLDEIEARYPSYHSAAVEQRARQHSQLAWSALLIGDLAVARHTARKGLSYSLRLGLLGWLTLLLAHLPRSVSERFLRVAQRFRRSRTLSWEERPDSFGGQT